MAEKMNRNVKLVAKGTKEQEWFDIYIDLIFRATGSI